MPDPSQPLAAGLPPALALTVFALAFGLMAIEAAASRLERHDLGESAVSLGVWLGGAVAKKALTGLVAAPYLFVWEHRIATIPLDGPLAVLALFLLAELCYYWMHRASHGVRWLWATHCVHHSPTRLNYTAAVRLGWTGPISGAPLFFLPLVWIGFHPLAVVATIGLGLIFQFFLHHERPSNWGLLEFVLNTPSHHRVHHAANGACLDKNFGGVLIVYDRLFGTFATAPTDERLVYGLAGRSRTLAPHRVLFGEWAAIGRDALRARGPRTLWRALFGPLGGAAQRQALTSSDTTPQP